MKHMLKRRTLLLGAVAALGVAAVVGTALAGSAGTVKTFTGCLSTGDGVIVKVKEGDQPKSPCSSGQTLARLSGGDITKISVTGGLTLPDGAGTGESGDVTIGLDPKYGLPQSCASGDVAKWSSSTSRWICAADNNTAYAAGTGLDLSSNTFSIDDDYRVKNTPDCDAGTFATGFTGSGTIECAAPPAASGLQAYAAQRATPLLLAGEMTVISKSVPAGTYVVFASAELYSEDDNDTSMGYCSIPGYVTSGGDLWGGAVLGHELDDDDTDLDTGNTESLSLTSTVTLASPGAIELKCKETEADVDLSRAALVALKVGALG
jgi:hypothetical protein